MTSFSNSTSLDTFDEPSASSDNFFSAHISLATGLIVFLVVTLFLALLFTLTLRRYYLHTQAHLYCNTHHPFPFLRRKHHLKEDDKAAHDSPPPTKPDIEANSAIVMAQPSSPPPPPPPLPSPLPIREWIAPIKEDIPITNKPPFWKLRRSRSMGHSLFKKEERGEDDEEEDIGYSLLSKKPGFPSCSSHIASPPSSSSAGLLMSNHPLRELDRGKSRAFLLNFIPRSSSEKLIVGRGSSEVSSIPCSSSSSSIKKILTKVGSAKERTGWQCDLEQLKLV